MHLIALWLLAWPGWAAAGGTGELARESCAPRIVAMQAARAAADAPEARPAQGWVDVTLPDVWTRRWRSHSGSVWYRIDWERACAPAAQTARLGAPEQRPEPVALGINGVSVAGEVYSGDDLLWRDASLVEPLSRSWNVPRWWVLPESGLGPGVNHIWVRAVGPVGVSPGLGALRLGDMASVAQAHAGSLWRQRTVYAINAVLCAMAGALFLMVWLLNREQQAYGWFGLMALCWLAYLSTYLAHSPWPWPDSLTRSRFSQVALIGYALCMCLFTFRFGGQRLPRVEKALYTLAAAGVVMLVLPRGQAVLPWMKLVWQGTMAVILMNGLQFQWHAWRPRPGGRQVPHMLLALCWLVFVVVGLATLFSALNLWQVARHWAALSGLSVTALVMLLLGAQLVRQMRSMARFNQTLATRVAQARAELAQANAREHTQALHNAKLQERMELAHDLHDSLGGSLVRGMALVKQAPEPLGNARMLSLLKSLRDDLRQVIDQGSSAGASLPETPVQWLAPMRHRFTVIFDELGIAADWQTPPGWSSLGGAPSVLQCLGLSRIVEESLSNVLKHSHARHVRVQCTQAGPQAMQVRIEDDGVGFDVAAVRKAGQSVGMRSMAARAARIGAVLDVESGVRGTAIVLTLPVGDAASSLSQPAPLAPLDRVVSP